MSEEYNNGGPPLKHIIPFWEKATMTLDEASEYSGIGRNTLYRLTNQNNCPFVLWVGSKRRIKRKQIVLDLMTKSQVCDLENRILGDSHSSK